MGLARSHCRKKDEKKCISIFHASFPGILSSLFLLPTPPCSTYFYMISLTSREGDPIPCAFPPRDTAPTCDNPSQKQSQGLCSEIRCCSKSSDLGTEICLGFLLGLFLTRQIYYSRSMVSSEVGKKPLPFYSLSNKRWWILPICWSHCRVRVATIGVTSASSSDTTSITRRPRRWSPQQSAMNSNSQPTLQKKKYNCNGHRRVIPSPGSFSLASQCQVDDKSIWGANFPKLPSPFNSLPLLKQEPKWVMDAGEVAGVEDLPLPWIMQWSKGVLLFLSHVSLIPLS